MLWGSYLAFFGMVGLWLLLRICLFFSDRIDSISMPQDIYPICTWMLRLILVIVAGGMIGFAIPGAFFAFGMGDAFGGKTSDGAYTALLFSALYFLSAMVMNFPFFPLPLHEKLFYPIHLVLLPCLSMLRHIEAFLMLLALLLGYFLLWRLCLSDRKKYG